MVLDVLIDTGVPVTFARTRVIPALLTPRERAGKALRIRRTTAGLELEELIFAGRDDRVAYSRDLFAPGGIEVMVMRSLESRHPGAGGVPARRAPGQLVERRQAGRGRARGAARAARSHADAPATPASVAARSPSRCRVRREPARAGRWGRSRGRSPCSTRWPTATPAWGSTSWPGGSGSTPAPPRACWPRSRARAWSSAPARAGPTGSGCGWSPCLTGCWASSTCASARVRC